jgi:hypothetical protein
MLIRWRLVATVGFSLAITLGCSGSSSHNDPDGNADAPGNGGTSGGSGARSSGGSSGTSAKGGSGGATTKGGAGGAGGANPGEPGACALGPADVLRVATQNLDSVLKSAISASAFVEGSSFVGRALALGDRHDPPIFVDDATKSVDELVDWLSQKVLAEGNALDTMGQSIHYSLKSEVYCAPDPDDVAADPEWAKEQEADCARDLAAHPVSFDAVFDACEGEGAKVLTITPEFGKAGTTPFALRSAGKSLSVTLDVAQGVKYAVEQDSSTMFDGDSYGAPTLTLSTEEANRVTLEVSLDGGLGLGFTQDDKRLRLETEPTHRFFQGGVDAVKREAWGNFALGTTTFTTSFKTFVEGLLQRNVTPMVSPNDSVAIEIPASAIDFDFQRDSEHLLLERSSPTADSDLVSVTNGNDTLIRANVNESRGGTVALNLDWPESGDAYVTLGPDFSLDLTFAMKNAVSKVENLQSFAADDVVSFALTSAPSSGSAPESPPASVMLLLNDDFDLALPHRTPGPQLVVNAGTFVMSSKAAAQTITVKSSNCLVYDPSSQVLHEILRGYGAASCPSVFK